MQNISFLCKRKFKRSAAALLCTAIILCSGLGIILVSIPKSISAYSFDGIEEQLGTMASFIKYDICEEDAVCCGSYTYSVCSDATAKLFGVIPLKSSKLKLYKKTELYVGGIPFGIKLQSGCITVVSLSEVETDSGSVCPATDAGIRPGDKIISIDAKKIQTVNELSDSVNASEGKKMTFGISRNGDTVIAELYPVLSKKGEYKTGLCVKDSTAGIGTVTFIDPENLCFAGLGHGICDAVSGEPLEFTKGTVMEVGINGINKGQSGLPGEIKGFFTSKDIGDLDLNLHSGVYGKFYELPDCIPIKKTVPIGLKSEVNEGCAVIYSTLADGQTKEYDIEISKINSDPNSLKSFFITVTDRELIEQTGGIIQGMSGSPILQNGKLIGAVTHVLVNDPTRGYGISIEDMLDSATENLAAVA